MLCEKAAVYGNKFIFGLLLLDLLCAMAMLVRIAELISEKWFHVKGMLFPGSLFALILGLLVGTAIAVIK